MNPVTGSIRWKLTASYLLLAVLTSLVFGLVSLYLINNFMVKREMDYLEQSASEIALSIKPYMTERRRSDEFRELASLWGMLIDSRIRILDKEKHLLVDTGRTVTALTSPQGSILSLIPQEDFYIIAQPMPMMRLHSQGSTDTGVTAKRSDLSVTMEIKNQDQLLGYIELAEGPRYSGEILKTSLSAFLLAFLGTGAISLVIGILMGKGLTTPIIRLNHTIRSYANINFSKRADETRNDEIGQLSRQFNSMADRLEASFNEVSRERDTLKRFIADASHELRTPVTALKGFTELLLNGAGEKQETRREFLEDSLAMIERMEWIIQNLLGLSRFDSGTMELEIEKIEVETLFQEVLAELKGKIAVKEARILMEGMEDEPVITCDRRWFVSVLKNLMDNALKYIETGGRISVKAVRTQAGTAVSIADSGPGIPDDEKEKVFQRFYRTKPEGEGGAGLGLSIVRSIVELHGGEITVSDAEGGGAVFTVFLPDNGLQEKPRT